MGRMLDTHYILTNVRRFQLVKVNPMGKGNPECKTKGSFVVLWGDLPLGWIIANDIGRIEPPPSSDGLCFGCEQGIKRVQDSDK